MPDRYAVVIGINYRNFPTTMNQAAQSRAGINALNYAEADAVDMAAMLTEGGYDVVKLVGLAATRDGIIDALMKQSRKAGPEGLLLVHYSGHGAIHPDNHELAYLLPADADPEEMAKDAIPLDSVARYYLGSTQSALMILDCCHSGYAVGLKSGDKDVALNSEAAEFSQQAGQTFRRVLGRVTIAACAGQQLAREREDLKHGVLTYYVLEHWRESADTVDDTSLYRYLAKRMPTKGVPAPVRGGTPQQGVIELRPARTLEVDNQSSSEEAVHTVEAEPPYRPPPVVLPQSTPPTLPPTQQDRKISTGPERRAGRWVILGSLAALIIIGLLGFLIIWPPRPPVVTIQRDWSGTWIKEVPLVQSQLASQLVEGASKLVIGTDHQVQVFADARYTLGDPGSQIAFDKSICDMCLWGTAVLYEPTHDPFVVELRLESPPGLLHELTMSMLQSNRLSVVEKLRLNSNIVDTIVYQYDFQRSP